VPVACPTWWYPWVQTACSGRHRPAF
jgi:hypothetical protein